MEEKSPNTFLTNWLYWISSGKVWVAFALCLVEYYIDEDIIYFLGKCTITRLI